MLLSFSADCHLKATNGLTALDLAERENHGEVSELIKEHMGSASADAKNGQMLLDKYLAGVKSELIDVVLLERLLKNICREQEDGAILVFLPGWEEISRVRDRLLQSQFFSNAPTFNILPLHSMIPSDEQKVFQRSLAGCRKIILSTNIAETAVTIDDVVYVIDCGRMKEKSYNPYKDVSTLES
ncbi:hypothetical protein MLD38_007305 [Melastoma candidum]|uniref:Uncharacterized protein n=1 Tax=Melastoma candidum TaxID=119954 RepID=A0ACB9RQE2_9MYRT|nr:hypothetical protein MLD38_007305 [Melastoma candidum]